LSQRQLADAKEDMAHLSKIVGDMTQLNNELNEKVTTMNREMEQLNSAIFESKAKAETAAELEKTLETAYEEQQSLRRLAKKQAIALENYSRYKGEVESTFV
jgi:chromosome segregation ATPase